MRVAGLDLSPRAAELLRAAVEADKVPAWQVVERAILAVLDGPGGSNPTPLPAEALEIAAEVVSFLEGKEDRPAAVVALRRAWEQALALARREVQRPTSGEE